VVYEPNYKKDYIALNIIDTTEQVSEKNNEDLEENTKSETINGKHEWFAPKR